MLSLWLLHLALSQAPAPPVAVILMSKRPGTESLGPALTQRVFEALKSEDVAGLLDDEAAGKQLTAAGIADSRSCDASRACLSRLAAIFGPKAVVVGVDVGKVGRAIAIHLEALSADRLEPLWTLDTTASLSEWPSAMSAPFLAFARETKLKVELSMRDDAPRRAELLPQASIDASSQVETKARPHLAAWVFTGSAVATAGVAVAFGVMSANQSAQFNASLVDLGDGTKGTRLSEGDARALASQANTNAAVAVASGIASAGLTAAAVIFFGAD